LQREVVIFEKEGQCKELTVLYLQKKGRDYKRRFLIEETYQRQNCKKNNSIIMSRRYTACGWCRAFRTYGLKLGGHMELMEQNQRFVLCQRPLTAASCLLTHP